MKNNLGLIKRNKFLQLWLIIGIIAGFLGVLFFSITYLNNKVLCDMSCRIQNEVAIALVLLSLFGMFIGSLTYYFISEKYEKKIINIQKNANLSLKFLDGENEKLIINSIIKNGGETFQSQIVKDTKLSRVKISRILKKLERKGVIIKNQKGMTNRISLDRELKKLFFE